jgi:diguanylate cyclase (GGDEF)-like protein
MKVYDVDQLTAVLSTAARHMESVTGCLDGSGEPRIEEEWLRIVQEIAGVGIWDWRIAEGSARCTESNTVLYGLPPSTVMPSVELWQKLIHPDDRARVLDELDSAAVGLSQFETEFRVICPDGALRWIAAKGRSVCDSDGKPIRLVGVNYDISRLKQAEQASKQAAEECAYQAQHDLLTGLPNRRFLDERLRDVVRLAEGTDEVIAVLYIDLDGFKIVNDSLGHAIGDELLRAVSGRLRDCISESDTLARTGGDEFTMILTGITGRQNAESAAIGLLNALQAPFHIAGHNLYVTASVGISIYPEDATDAGILQQNADIAMYRTKHSAKNGYQFFAPGMIEPMRERLALETSLRGALEGDEFLIHYQPLFGIGNGNCATVPAGYEALLRWRHPQLGFVSPATFIPIAEETGMIITIGTWVLRTVCEQIRQWHAGGLPQLRVNVNVSGLQFAMPDFVEIVARALEDTGVRGECLGIEITESVLMGDFDVCSRTIRDLQDLGVSISIDDFGAGYSSLGYLQRMPINALKIDGSFVREIGVKPTATALIEAIVALAHSLNMRVIAECVETEQQLEALLSAGCDEAQGYLLGRPAGPQTVVNCVADPRL